MVDSASDTSIKDVSKVVYCDKSRWNRATPVENRFVVPHECKIEIRYVYDGEMVA